MMAMRRTPLLPPGWGRGRPRRSSIGPSSAAGAAGGGVGVLLDGGWGFVALRIGFRVRPPNKYAPSEWMAAQGTIMGF
jgi:hypothetical protein